ncbi:unnamed protein product [Parascedosporium putredinis]|uniref:GPI mannosyltransferase 1 n=1 Tax=Parascedosporium putredinis TaxID=1442378 RepID=A0A9P1MFF7_9PEZI|nr:unnamed protein product [Parascedosporium putredinis]CAI8003361.1 unnamed protein product [Parascedosporium putredinis]
MPCEFSFFSSDCTSSRPPAGYSIESSLRARVRRLHPRQVHRHRLPRLHRRRPLRRRRRLPYDRETYRYTPLLAWFLLPTATWFFSFGKLVFAAADLLAGWLLARILIAGDGGGGGGHPPADAGPGSASAVTRRRAPMDPARAYRFAAIWLLNPMVATISTRGSSEGLLGVLTAALLWAVYRRRFALAALLLGLGVHFKIYPFIYGPAIIWWMDEDRLTGSSPTTTTATATKPPPPSPFMRALFFITPTRVKFAIISLATFTALNLLMYSVYGTPFILHTFLHHVSRVDHRHNFSPYNVLLYLSSSRPAGHHASAAALAIESLAFLPQLLLSALLIPLVVAKRDLATSMMAQTFAFVTFNKVCTSQALWLHQAFQLEFLGRSTFTPGLWAASLAFFLVNCWILGIVVWDGAVGPSARPRPKRHNAI